MLPNRRKFLETSLWGSSLLTLGANSELVLDNFSFDSTTHDGGMLVSLWRGTVAVVTGLIGRKAPEKLRFQTRTVVLGVRAPDEAPPPAAEPTAEPTAEPPPGPPPDGGSTPIPPPISAAPIGLSAATTPEVVPDQASGARKSVVSWSVSTPKTRTTDPTVAASSASPPLTKTFLSSQVRTAAKSRVNR